MLCIALSNFCAISNRKPKQYEDARSRQFNDRESSESSEPDRFNCNYMWQVYSNKRITPITNIIIAYVYLNSEMNIITKLFNDVPHHRPVETVRSTHDAKARPKPPRIAHRNRNWIYPTPKTKRRMKRKRLNAWRGGWGVK